MNLGQRYQGTRIEAPPSFVGVAGRSAWRLELAEMGQREKPDHDATVGGYIVKVPGAHILWDHWVVSVIHLRPLQGVAPAKKRFDAATHEFLIVALNPEHPLPSLKVERGWRPRYLTPIDVVEQFAARDDVEADRMLELAARAIVDGFASPDEDWRSWWKVSIEETARHFAAGQHRVERH